MSEKRKNESVDTSGEKRRSHKLKTVETKMEIIRRAESGESYVSIGSSFKLNRSTVHAIVKDKNKIKEYVRNSGNISSTVITKKRGVVFEEMERSLKEWIEDLQQKNISPSIPIIRVKAISLYEDWKKRLGEEAADTPYFQASKGWFSRFKIRARSIKLTGESATADEGTKEFKTALHNIKLTGESATADEGTKEFKTALHNIKLSGESATADEAVKEFRRASLPNIKFTGDTATTDETAKEFRRASLPNIKLTGESATADEGTKEFQRACLHNIKLTGEPATTDKKIAKEPKRACLHNKLTGTSATADKKAVKEFIKKFAEIVEEGDYSTGQIYNVDETGLFWKKLPARTYLGKEEKVAPGLKEANDRLTLLLGGNAAGDLKLKPMLVYHSENPRALKEKVKGMLPVIWKANSKAWVTGTIFQDWFSLHFVPAVRQYCSSNNLPFRALLILDNAPGHPYSLQDLYPEIKVVFMPPNTTRDIQPMDQKVKDIFKRYYIRRILNQAIRATDKEDGPTLKEFWEGFNIWNAINNIGDAWAEIKESTMNGCWKKLCPELVPNFEGFEETPEAATEEVVQLMNQLDLGVCTEDVDELIASHSQLMSSEDLIAMQEVNKAPSEDQDDDCIIENLPNKILTVRKMNEAFTHLEQFVSIMEEYDPNAERSSHIRRAIDKNTSCYRLLYKEKKSAVQLYLDVEQKCISLKTEQL